MDAGITAAARALDAGDVIAALQLVTTRSDPAALALRGIAMARLGELAAARACLQRAAQAFAGDRHARARCTLARAEVELAMRNLARPTDLTEVIDALERSGDARNAAWARLVEARRAIVLGRLGDAERSLDQVPERDLPPVVLAVRSLAELEVALRRLDGSRARAAVTRAEALARSTRFPALEAEIARAAQALDRVVARVRSADGAWDARLEDLGALAASGALVIDACRRRVGRGPVTRDLRARPSPFALLRALGEAHPRGVARDRLAAILFGAGRPNESHRVRLRVEVGRARGLVRGLCRVVATEQGFRLDAEAHVVVLAPPDESEGADVLALVESGEAWSAASLAAALGCGTRRVQRALKDLAAAGRVRSHGRGRARRWTAAPRIASHLLLPGLLLMR
jgi:tetratricopeptide (TPR) repeat protein